MQGIKCKINNYCLSALDSKELKLNKYLILLTAISCSICGFFWAIIYYSIFGNSTTALLPLLFVLIVVPSIFISHSLDNYKILLHTQLICISLIPLLIQWSLGSINDSGFVIFWCFLSPLGALQFLGTQSAKVWMSIFFLIVLSTVYITPVFTSDSDMVTEKVRASFFMMNITAPLLIVFKSVLLFLKKVNGEKKKREIVLEELNKKNRVIQESLDLEKELGQIKSNFVNTVSHQFRTPLAVIQSNAELLEMYTVEGEMIDKKQLVTGRIRKAIHKMTTLMNDVLSVGQLGSGSLQSIPEDIDMITFLEELAKEFNEVQTDERFLECKINGEPYHLCLDKRLLSHALSNLISNAFKYSLEKENPQLVIDFKPNELVLSIIDYGIGIPKDQLSSLFTPFFRANNAILINGTGLGLSIAKEYVEINKGSITVTSILAKGSCFEITFKREKL